MKTKYLESKKLSILLFIFVFVVFSAIYMTKNMFSAAMASIVENGVMTKSETGAISAVFWLVYAIFQVIGGFITDRVKTSVPIYIALAGGAIANLVIYFNQSYAVIMVAWVFNAIAQFGLWPATFKIVSTQLAPSVRKACVFWILFTTTAGIGLSMLVASFFSRWQDNFLFSAIVIAVLLLMWILIFPFFEGRMVEKETVADKKEGSDTVEQAGMKKLLLGTGLLVISIIVLLRNMIDNAVKMLAPTMFMESYENISAAVANRLSLIIIVMSAVGILLSMFVNTRLIKNEIKAAVVLVLLGLPLMVVCCFVGKINYWIVLITLSVSIMFIHSASGLTQSLVSVKYERFGKVGTIAGFLNAMASVGNILASYVFARFAEVMSWTAVAVSWVIILVIIIILALCVLPIWTRFCGYGKYSKEKN